MNLKNKKGLSVVLIGGLLLSTISPFAISYAQDRINNVVGPVVESMNTNESEQVPQEMPEMPVLEPIVIAEKASNARGAARKKENPGNKALINKSRSSEKKDKYNIGQEQLDQYIREGFGLEDIYTADELANKYDIGPDQLLNEHKIQKDWGEIEATLKAKRNSEALKHYDDKYKKELKWLEDNQVEESLHFELIALYDQYQDVSTIEELAKLRNQQDTPSVLKELNARKAKLKVSADRLKKHNLKESDVEGLNNKTFDALAEISEKSNTPLKTVINNFKEEKRKDDEKRKGK